MLTAAQTGMFVVWLTLKSSCLNNTPTGVLTVWCFAWPADQKGKFDELIEEHGVRLLIDPAALMHVLGTTMDYIDEPLKWVVQDMPLQPQHAVLTACTAVLQQCRSCSKQ